MLFLPAIYHHNNVIGKMEFLIDTGSPFTVISPREGLRFRYPLKQMSRQNAATVQLAGFKFKRYPLGAGVSLTVEDDSRNPINLAYAGMSLLTPTKCDDTNLKACKHIPSIIGVDFMTSKDATLVYNPRRNIAFFELP